MNSYILLFTSIGLGIAGQLLLKKGVVDSQLAMNLPSLIKTVFSPLVFSGLALYGISAMVWLFVLKRFPLSVAYPSLALSYVAIVVLSAVFMNEPVTRNKIGGIIFIIIGVYFLYR